MEVTFNADAQPKFKGENVNFGMASVVQSKYRDGRPFFRIRAFQEGGAVEITMTADEFEAFRNILNKIDLPMPSGASTVITLPEQVGGYAALEASQ